MKTPDWRKHFNRYQQKQKGLTYKTIAKEYNVSISAIRQSVMKWKRHLRKYKKE